MNCTLIGRNVRHFNLIYAFAKHILISTFADLATSTILAERQITNNAIPNLINAEKSLADSDSMLFVSRS